MSRTIALALAATAASASLGACGSSSSTSTTSSSTSASSSAAISVPGGGGFCAQVASVVAQLGQLSSGLTSPGAIPSLSAIQQVVAAEVRLLDTLDGSAPSAIASAVHTLRVAFDQVSGQVQSATTLQQLSAAFAALGGADLASASSAIGSYLSSSCGIGTSASTT